MMIQEGQDTLVRVPCPVCGATSSRPERTVNGYALERCAKCRMVFVNPQYPPGALLEQYDHKDAGQQLAIWARINTPTMLADFDRILDDIEAMGGRRER